jgi:transposase-like protein
MTREMLRRWVRRAQVNGGLRSGVTTAERERIREPERENRELRRANEILRAASQRRAEGAQAELGEGDYGLCGVEAVAAADDQSDLLVGALDESVG